MARLIKDYQISALDLFNHPARIGKGKLTEGKNAILFPDGHAEKRKGYIENADYDKFFISKTIINIIKFQDYTVVFYSDGTIRTDQILRLWIKWFETAVIDITRGANVDSWEYELTKKLVFSSGYLLQGNTHDNENLYVEAGIFIKYANIYGKSKMSLSNGSETIAVQVGDKFAINGIDLYMPALSGPDDLYFDTEGNSYYDEDLTQSAYFKKYKDLLNFTIYDKIKFNDIHILTDDQQLYKLYKTRSKRDYENKAYSIINNELIIRSRNDNKFIEKIIFTVKGGSLKFCLDYYTNTIVISTTYNDGSNNRLYLQVFSLVTNSLIYEDDIIYTPSAERAGMMDIVADKDYIWVMTNDNAPSPSNDVTQRIHRILKSDYSIIFTYIESVSTLFSAPHFSSMDVDYFGDRLFIGFNSNPALTDPYLGAYFSKITTGTMAAIWASKIGVLDNSSTFVSLHNIKIFEDRAFSILRISTPGYRLYAWKKNAGNNNYSPFGGTPTDLDNAVLLDILVYDKEENRPGLQAVACYYTRYIAGEWRIEVIYYFVSGSFLSGYNYILDAALVNQLIVSKDQDYIKDEEVRIKPLLKPDDHVVSLLYGYFVSGVQDGLLGDYVYKIKYVQGLRESQFSDDIEISILQKAHVLIERINPPDDCTTEVYRKLSTGEWLYVGSTTEDYFVDHATPYTLKIVDSVRTSIIPKGRFLEVFYNILWVFGNDENKNYGFFSNTNNAEFFDVRNFIVFHEFKEFKGVRKLSEGGIDSLFVYGDKGVCRISGFSAETLNVDYFNKEITQAIHKTIKQYKNIHILQSGNTIYKFDGRNYIDISSKILGGNIQHSENNYAVIHDDKYVLFANRVFVYDFILEKFFQQPVWLEYTNYDFGYAEVVDNTFLGSKNDKIYELNNGYQDDGSNITLTLKTKQFEFGDPLIRNILERLHVITGLLTDEIFIKLYTDDRTPHEKTFEITSNDDRDQAILKIRPVRGRGKFFQVEINESQDDNIKIYGLDFRYRSIKMRRNNTKTYNVT